MSGGPEAGAAPAGPNMGMLASMQMKGAPGQRFIGNMLPALDYSVGMPQGFMAFKLGLFGFGSLQSGHIGPMAFAQGLRSCFVDVGTMSAWNVDGVHEHFALEAPMIAGAPIDGMPIEGEPIRGEEIRAAAASAGFEDVGSAAVSAPKIAAHQAAVAASQGMDIA